MNNLLYNKLKLHLTLLCSIVVLGNIAFAQDTPATEHKNFFINQDRSLTIYPMPANTVAYIRIAPALRSIVDKVEIVNIIGRKVTEQSIIDKSTTEVVFTDLGDMPKGMYMVIARDKSGRIVQSAKLILNEN